MSHYHDDKDFSLAGWPVLNALAAQVKEHVALGLRMELEPVLVRPRGMQTSDLYDCEELFYTEGAE